MHSLIGESLQIVSQPTPLSPRGLVPLHVPVEQSLCVERAKMCQRAPLGWEGLKYTISAAFALGRPGACSH